MKKPTLIESPNIEELKQSCQDYLDSFEDKDWNEDRMSKFGNPIFEAALIALFGEGVFNWVNNKIDENENK